MSDELKPDRSPFSIFLPVIATIIFLMFVVCVFFATSLYYRLEEIDSARITKQQQVTFKDFSADGFNLDANLTLFDTRAYLQLDIPGKASDNVEELNKVFTKFEADNNSVINHWHEDEDDPLFEGDPGYLHGIWISFQERPVDYR